MQKFRLFLISSLLLFFTLGCSAQSGKTADDPVAVNRRIADKIRATFALRPTIDITVGKRSPSEIPGYDKVPITLSENGRGTTHDFLINKDNTAIIEWEKLDISKDVMQSIALDGRPERGNKDAKVTIINYDDFECPFCSKMHQTLFPELMKSYGNQVKVIYKDYPLVEIHPWAMHAAIDANCLAVQSGDAYWAFADYTHANQKDISGEKHDIHDEFAKLDQITLEQGKKYGVNLDQLDACVKKQDESTVRASMTEGDKLGVDSTPTMFVNGERVAGVLPDTVLRNVIDRALKDAGETPPSPTPVASTEPKSGAQ